MRHIHKQADGLYAVWSVDRKYYLAVDCTSIEAMDVYNQVSFGLLKQAAERDLELGDPADEKLIKGCRKEMA